ncbi:hypothetical protein K502DRAFT_316677 [Neoconidiobolus thromboides FSU 785]|nr:hypothetical protein K502DRAFT_316677 [Neoconidiobolus thromboides FSU 785]
MIELYDLVNKKDGNHFSPFSWRSIMALKHKGIEFTQHGLTFTEINEQIPKLSNGEWDKVPFIKFDNNNIVYDSTKIADYLEERYPGNPLFPNGRYFSSFLENHANIFAPLFQSIILNVYDSLLPKDQEYFRKTREAWFGMTLEEFAGKKEGHKEAIEKLFLPFRMSLVNIKYLEGDKPSYSDYVLFGHLKFVQMTSISTFDMIVTNHQDQSLKDWWDSIQSLNDGFAASFKP